MGNTCIFKKKSKKSTGSNAYTNSKLSAINILSTTSESEKTTTTQCYTEIMRVRCGMKRIKKKKKGKKIVKMRDSVTQKMNLNFLFTNIDFAEDKQTHIYKRSHKNTHTHIRHLPAHASYRKHTHTHPHTQTKSQNKKAYRFVTATAVSQFAL